MQTLNETLRRFAASRSDARASAEVLEWMGTSYGLRAGPDPAPAAEGEEASSVAEHVANQSESSGPVTARPARRQRQYAFAGIAALVAALSALAVVRGWTGAERTVTAGRATPVQAAPAASNAANDLVARAKREAEDAKAKLAAEYKERQASDKRAAELAALLDAEAHARKHVEKASSELSAELEAERQARREAEQIVRLRKDELAQPANGAASGPVTEVRNVVPAATAAVPPIRIDGIPTAAAADLIEGQKLFAKGDLSAARKRFESVAAKGLPEGALAAGNTFDPVTLAKAGLTQAGDPVQARRWYRRAHELAQLQRPQLPRRDK